MVGSPNPLHGVPPGVEILLDRQGGLKVVIVVAVVVVVGGAPEMDLRKNCGGSFVRRAAWLLTSSQHVQTPK